MSLCAGQHPPGTESRLFVVSRPLCVGQHEPGTESRLFVVSRPLCVGQREPCTVDRLFVDLFCTFVAGRRDRPENVGLFFIYQ